MSRGRGSRARGELPPWTRGVNTSKKSSDSKIRSATKQKFHFLTSAPAAPQAKGKIHITGYLAN